MPKPLKDDGLTSGTMISSTIPRVTTNGSETLVTKTYQTLTTGATLLTLNAKTIMKTKFTHKKERRIIWYILRSYHHVLPHRAKLYLKTWDSPDDPKVNRKAYLKVLKNLINNRPLWVVMDHFK